MRRSCPCLLVAALSAGLLMGAGEPPIVTPAPAAPDRVGPPPDFKLEIAFYGALPRPLATADLVVVQGVAYQFIAESPAEVMVIDAPAARVFLFNLNRRRQTELTAKRLDGHLGRLRRQTLATIERDEAAGTRAGRIAATMARQLIDPQFQTTEDPATHRLRLTNPTAEITIQAEPEPDRARRQLIANALAAIIKIGALRDPDSPTITTRLEAVRAVAADRPLRPTEISFLYRLAGPPQRVRWTYHLVPTLSDREHEAIARIERVRGAVKVVPFEVYEEDEPAAADAKAP